jgi:uncharacterized protein YhfF
MAQAIGVDALPEAVARPNDEALASFWHAVETERSHWTPPASFEVRCFGTTRDNTEETLRHVAQGAKSATYRAAPVLEALGRRPAAAGDVAVLVDWDGAPRLAVRYVETELTPFARIAARHTALEGPLLRDVNLWKQVHREHWSGQLAVFGLAFSEDLLVAVERFDLLYSPGTAK